MIVGGIGTAIGAVVGLGVGAVAGGAGGVAVGATVGSKLDKMAEKKYQNIKFEGAGKEWTTDYFWMFKTNIKVSIYHLSDCFFQASHLFC